MFPISYPVRTDRRQKWIESKLGVCINTVRQPAARSFSTERIAATLRKGVVKGNTSSRERSRRERGRRDEMSALIWGIS